MGVGKYRAKVDANQQEIVKQFRDLGCSVHPLHMVGKGFPDIIIAKAGVNVLVEIKDGDKPPSARKLTTDEQVFHESWQGQIAIVENFTDVLEVMQLMVPRGTTR